MTENKLSIKMIPVRTRIVSDLSKRLMGLSNSANEEIITRRDESPINYYLTGMLAPRDNTCS